MVDVDGQGQVDVVGGIDRRVDAELLGVMEGSCGNTYIDMELDGSGEAGTAIPFVACVGMVNVTQLK